MLKELAGKFFDNITISSFDWQSGNTKELISGKNIKDALSEIFGKIDPDQFKSTYDANIKKKFQKT
jgi:hypothetical protein